MNLAKAFAKAVGDAARKQVAASKTIRIKEYKNARAFQRDAVQMLAQGWHIEGQNSTTGMSAGGTAAKLVLTGGLGLITGTSKKHRTVVTWRKEGG